MASTFPGVIAFAFMVAMILAGVVLRARISFLQNNLVPASLIGGVLGFGLISAGWSLGYQSGDFTIFAFHFFTLSFMSLVLTGTDKATVTKGGVAPGGMWLSIVWIMSLVLQALVGLVVIMAYNAISGEELSHFLGMIATHGFTQGPGQALALGNIWENELGVTQAIKFGLTYASAGFIAAFLVGVPVARWAIRSGLNFNQSARIDQEFLKGIMQSEASAGNQITHSANVDSLVYHIAILGVAYVITDQYLLAIQPIASELSMGGVQFGIIFTHNLFFLHGLIVCVILRAAMDKLGLGHMIDNGTQRRITGSSVDLMVVATIMSVEFAFVVDYFVPILLVCVAVTGVTALLCFGFGRKLATLGIERSITIFGCCTGSTGSGLLLLRILDPELNTPVARELAFFNIAILFLGFHVLTVMAPVLPGYGLGTIVGVYIATFIVGAVALTFLSGRVGSNQSG